MTDLTTHTGGCHCGAVRYSVAVRSLAVKACNCSICEPCGYLHLIVPKAQFELHTPWEALSLYTFNSGIAQHWFCKTCGIKSFYLPRSHPEGYSINARCLTNVELEDLDIVPFDGRNWEQNVASIQ
ncbi:MAG: GFA family protein [Pseudomonadales bacterium]